MTAIYEIPTQPSQPQQYSISLSGVVYQLLFTWNVPSAAWLLTISDAQGNVILSNVPLVTGDDLLSQFAYLGIGGELIVQTDHNVDAVPTFSNLGVNGHLYFITP